MQLTPKNLYRTILHVDMSLADDIADSLNEAFSEQGFGCVCASHVYKTPLVWITLCVYFLCSFLCARLQESLEGDNDLPLVDWSKDRLIVQRVKHGRSFTPADPGCEPADK